MCNFRLASSSDFRRHVTLSSQHQHERCTSIASKGPNTLPRPTLHCLILTNVKAEKKAQSRGGLFGGGGSSRFEEAAELYTQAANAFRLQKLGKEAGQALERAASMQMKTDERDDAANTLVEAYKSYRRTDPADAARVLKQAIALFTGKGNFRRAAGYQFNLAELYEMETELFRPEEALDAYDSAAEWYASDQADAYLLPLCFFGFLWEKLGGG
jgi:tetratricopeptide (TPR) repeat protein